MKSTLLLFAILLSKSLFSQTPAYFENNQEWLSTFSFYSPGISDCVENSTYVDYVNGDTLISGITYKKIGRRYSTSYFPMSSATCPNDAWGDIVNHRYLRQSSDSIFEYLPQSGNEELLISYNVNIGSSFTLTSFVTQNFTVQDIDTIVLNGQNHRMFYVDTVNDYVVIEGVGHYSSENGGFLDYWGFGTELDQTTSLDCYAQNGTTYWSHPDITLGSCSYLNDLGISNLVGDFEFMLFPNPAEELIHVESYNSMSSIKIISISGAVLFELEASIDANNIDISGLDEGNYLMLVTDDKGRQSTRLFQKM